jgi:hypothetical protein
MESGMQPQAGVPKEKEVRQALSRLVVHGADAVWSPKAQPLLRLPRVRERIDELGEDQAAEALRQVLQEAIDNLGQSQYRLLLTIVLGLSQNYEDLSAGDKRALAGKEFRGGTKPVSAGTIRQHHEPRALDELASLLVSNEGISRRLAAPREDQPIAWHPEVHRRLANERLVFWRMSFFPYYREDVIQDLAKAMRSNDIRSWSAHELYGVFDLLVKAWIPATEPEGQIVRNLQTELRSLELIQSFTVERVVFDSLWTAEVGLHRAIAEEKLDRLPSASEIGRINAGSQELDRYEAEGLVARRPVVTGVDFFVALSQRSHAALHSPMQSRLDDWITDIARSAGSLSNLTIYAGAGFATFLIGGTVPPNELYDLHGQLLGHLAPLDHLVSQRVDTFISSMPGPIAAVEEMRGGDPAAGTRDVEDLLQQEEGARFEVRGSAFTDMRRLESVESAGKLPQSRAAADALLKAIVAFLNSEGGVVVIGAMEAEAIAKFPQLMESEVFNSAPRRGPYIINGIDHELGDGTERFRRRLLDIARSAIEPNPGAFLNIEFERVDGRTVGVVQIGHPREWFYLQDRDKHLKFYVRQGPSVIELMGSEADRFKSSAKRTSRRDATAGRIRSSQIR